MIEVRHYATSAGKDLIAAWLDHLADDHAAARIVERLDRLSRGLFGDCRSLGGGLFELRIDWGPGYRIYYAMVGRTCVVLLCGGDKRKQSPGIQRARQYLRDYTERTRTQ